MERRPIKPKKWFRWDSRNRGIGEKSPKENLQKTTQQGKRGAGWGESEKLKKQGGRLGIWIVKDSVKGRERRKVRKRGKVSLWALKAGYTAWFEV